MNKYDYSEERVKFLKDNVKGISLSELAQRYNKKFNCNLPESAFQIMKRTLKITSGVDSNFKKGNVPWNKGKKMSSEQYEKLKATMFKKGSIPPNHKEIGSERLDSDGYTMIKIKDGCLNKNWVLKHRYIYESVYGNIPPGYKLIFADGNKRNFDINNLVLVSNAEELIMNQKKLIKSDSDLTKAGLNVAKIFNKVRKRK